MARVQPPLSAKRLAINVAFERGLNDTDIARSIAGSSPQYVAKLRKQWKKATGRMDENVVRTGVANQSPAVQPTTAQPPQPPATFDLILPTKRPAQIQTLLDNLAAGTSRKTARALAGLTRHEFDKMLAKPELLRDVEAAEALALRPVEVNITKFAASDRAQAGPVGLDLLGRKDPESYAKRDALDVRIQQHELIDVEVMLSPGAAVALARLNDPQTGLGARVVDATALEADLQRTEARRARLGLPAPSGEVIEGETVEVDGANVDSTEVKSDE